MIKVTRNDIRSLLFAMEAINALQKQSLSEDFRCMAKGHIRRIRKVQLLLLDAVDQSYLDFVTKIKHGVPEGSKFGKGVSALCDDRD